LTFLKSSNLSLKSNDQHLFVLRACEEFGVLFEDDQVARDKTIPRSKIAFVGTGLDWYFCSITSQAFNPSFAVDLILEFFPAV